MANPDKDEVDIKELIKFRRDPVEIKKGRQITYLHVGATEDKLEDLEKLLVRQFDQSPKITKKSDRDTIDLCLTGKIRGVTYRVELEEVECPVPISMATIHHATVILPYEHNDLITPILEREFKEYERELALSR